MPELLLLLRTRAVIMLASQPPMALTFAKFCSLLEGEAPVGDKLAHPLGHRSPVLGEVQ